MGPLSDIGLAFLAIAVSIAGWLQARRLGVAQAQQAAREAKDDLIETQRAQLSLANGEARLLRETIDADRREDAARDRSLEDCRRELELERGISQRLAQTVEVAYAAEWAEQRDG